MTPEKVPGPFLAAGPLRLSSPDDRVDAPSSIDCWLAVFVRLLHLPQAKRDAIRAELREHLIERVRDLELAGTSEPDAIGAALAELGETAALAQRFDAANRPHRRSLLMYLSLIGAATGAIALTVVTWNSAAPPENTSLFQAQTADAQPPESFAKTKLKGAPGELRELIEVLSSGADRPIFVRWNELHEVGIDESSAVQLTTAQLSLAKAFEITARELTQAAGGNRVAWRFSDELIELGLQHSFDLENVHLVNYDIAAIVQSMRDTYERPYENAVADILNLIMNMVSPADWRENGGDIAHQTVVAGRLFVEAPPRIHEKVEWILRELAKEIEGEAGARLLPPADAAAAAEVQVFPLGNVEAGMLASMLTAILKHAGGVTFDARTNSLIIQGTPELQHAMKELIRRLDREEGGDDRIGALSDPLDATAPANLPKLEELIALHPELGAAFDRLTQAKTDFELIRQRFQPTSTQYAENEHNLANAQHRYNRAYAAALKLLKADPLSNGR